MSEHKGILKTIKAHLERNRLGELLVIQGSLTPQQLKTALSLQSEIRAPLGQVLVKRGFVSAFDIRRAIATQWAMRGMAAAVTIMISVSALSIRQADANTMRDSVPQSSIAQTVAMATGSAMGSIGQAASYPELFGSGEKRSSDLSAFTKWSAMFSRFDRDLKDGKSQKIVANWKSNLEAMRGLPLDEMASRVNGMVNQVRYINDSKNWGKSDYWETPVEFFSKGGDCEDFAITKYASLRALGVPDNRMRIAIVKDTQKNIPHAILIVYTDKGPYVLDNQIKTMTASASIRHYKPIFSINRTAWWLHTAPKATLVASR